MLYFFEMSYILLLFKLVQLLATAIIIFWIYQPRFLWTDSFFFFPHVISYAGFQSLFHRFRFTDFSHMAGLAYPVSDTTLWEVIHRDIACFLRVVFNFSVVSASSFEYSPYSLWCAEIIINFLCQGFNILQKL